MGENDRVQDVQQDKRGQVAIVTGATSGIGRATAFELAQRGYALALNGRRGERLTAVVHEIEAGGGRAIAVAGDICDQEVRRSLVRQTVETFGRLDVLINNAGGARSGSTEALSSADIRLQFELNVLAPIELTRLALPELRRVRGTIVNIASIVSIIAMPPLGVYSATKFALAGWTEALRRELAPAGVRVSLVNPGPVATEFSEVANYGGEVPTGGVSAQRVARAIARVVEHPRRSVMVPGLLAPVALLGQLLPGVVDVGVRLAQRYRPQVFEPSAPELTTPPASADTLAPAGERS